MEDDNPVEVATVGREGFIGQATTLGIETSSHRVICQMGGDILRLPIRPFLEALARAPRYSRLVHRYLAFTLKSTGQGIACNATHQIEERASRWLLVIHNQAASDEFPMTHEFLASMLGMRRQSVTVVAGALQRAGLITYRLGAVTVLDGTGLEKAACECYAANRAYYDRVVS